MFSSHTLSCLCDRFWKVFTATPSNCSVHRMRGALTQWGWRQFISWLVRVPRPTLLRVEVPVALNAGTVQLMIETPDGQVGSYLCFVFSVHQAMMDHSFPVKHTHKHTPWRFGPSARNEWPLFGRLFHPW